MQFERKGLFGGVGGVIGSCIRGGVRDFVGGGVSGIIGGGIRGVAEVQGRFTQKSSAYLED